MKLFCARGYYGKDEMLLEGYIDGKLTRLLPSNEEFLGEPTEPFTQYANVLVYALDGRERQFLLFTNATSSESLSHRMIGKQVDKKTVEESLGVPSKLNNSPTVYCVTGFYDHEAGVTLEGFVNGKLTRVTTFNTKVDVSNMEQCYEPYKKVQVFQLSGEERKWLGSTDKVPAKQLSRWLYSHQFLNKDTLDDAISACVLAQTIGAMEYF